MRNHDRTSKQNEEELVSEQHDHDSTEPVPEADALEQETPLEIEPADEEIELPHGVPDDASEADALEQATPVPGQGDEDVSR